MDIQFKRADSHLPEFSQIQKLYQSAFPMAERAPFWLLARRTVKPNVEFLAAFDGKQWVGFAYVIRNGDFVYLFYLAIQDAVRGHGYGSRVLQAIKARYSGCRIFLAIEPVEASAPNYEQRINRLKFYQRNGFFQTGKRLREGPVAYELLGNSKLIRPSEYASMMQDYMGPILRRLVKTEVYD